MDVRTYRAATMHEALDMVQRDLGPDAAVLHTREVRTRRWFGWLSASREIEVMASAAVNVPSRLPSRQTRQEDYPLLRSDSERFGSPVPPVVETPHVEPLAADEMRGQLESLQAMVRQLCQRSQPGGKQRDWPDSLFRLYTELIDVELNEDLARELTDRMRSEASGAELNDPVLLKARISRMVEGEIPVAGAIRLQPGVRRLVALVGPTGVGKTTTIAKLAANFRLREKRRVGFITVDTYRIAAVEQLRTYADIIDLPMQVVSSPREMRDAVRRMEHLDLVLMDTAGRSPKDEVKIRELKTFLTEAGADEVHLVLSSVASPKALQQTAERFAAVGTTALILTKLDESSGLGNLLPLVRECGLPLSYLTNGQNVPDDIETAEPRRLSRQMLGLESASHGWGV